MHRIFADRAARRRLRLISGGEDPEDLTWPQLLKILMGTSRGIEYLHTSDRSSHKREILHRDIKPSNILLDRDLEPRLSDVGLAREMAAGGSHRTASVLVGTNGYLDPHAVQSGRYDKKTDGYAFGVTMLQVLTKWPVFDEALGDEGHIIQRCSERGLEIDNLLLLLAGRIGANSLPDGMWKRLLNIALALVKQDRRRRISVADARMRLEGELDELDLRAPVPVQEPVERECIVCMSAAREVRYGCGHSQVCNGCFVTIMARCPCPAPLLYVPHICFNLAASSFASCIFSCNTVVARDARCAGSL
jgi:serine/threonine protein kinase